MATNTKAYPLSRDYKASARLNLQHFLHAKDVGFVIHPSIPTDIPNIKVADVGTGTGIWLIDLQGQLPSNAVLDGYDVSTAQFPPPEWLPSNVRLSALDIFRPIPEHLQGKYDIVHLRYFCCVVRDNNPHLIIKNVMKLLRPGGWLQWSEQDYTRQSVITANPNISPEPFSAVKAEIENQTRSSRARFRWLGELDATLELHGFTDVAMHCRAEQSRYYSIWHQTHMMVAEEMSYSVPGGDKIRDRLTESQIETPEGVFWHRGHLCFIAHKPITKTISPATNGMTKIVTTGLQRNTSPTRMVQSAIEPVRSLIN